LGQKEQALDYFRRVLPIQREIRSRAGEAQALNNIGVAYIELGQKAQALKFIRRALRIQNEISYNLGERDTEFKPAIAHLEQSNVPEAIDELSQRITFEEDESLVGRSSVSRTSLTELEDTLKSLVPDKTHDLRGVESESNPQMTEQQVYALIYEQVTNLNREVMALTARLKRHLDYLDQLDETVED
jgi:tetratricopeptide (TPR) repeat protein